LPRHPQIFPVAGTRINPLAKILCQQHHTDISTPQNRAKIIAPMAIAFQTGLRRAPFISDNVLGGLLHAMPCLGYLRVDPSHSFPCFAQPSAWISDKYDRRTVILPATGIKSTALALTPFVRAAEQLYAVAAAS